MKKRYRYVLMLLLVLAAAVLVYVCHGSKVSIVQYSSVGRHARIRPDYYDTVIPPNIAPLNFLVEEDGSYYCVKISSQKGEIIEIFSRSPKIMIPQGTWHELLKANPGGELNFDIFVQTQEKQWNRFDTITNKIGKLKQVENQQREADGYLSAKSRKL